MRVNCMVLRFAAARWRGCRVSPPLAVIVRLAVASRAYSRRRRGAHRGTRRAGRHPRPVTVAALLLRAPRPTRLGGRLLLTVGQRRVEGLRQRRGLSSCGQDVRRRHGGSNLRPRQRRGPSRNTPLETWCRCGHTEARSNQSEWPPLNTHFQPRADKRTLGFGGFS